MQMCVVQARELLRGRLPAGALADGPQAAVRRAQGGARAGGWGGVFKGMDGRHTHRLTVPHPHQAATMTEADVKDAMGELEGEVRRLDMAQAYREMRRAQAELARSREGRRLAQRAAEVKGG